jgi:hypothetical protein
MIISTIKNGRIEIFGKNGIKFISKYKRGNVICVGERKFDNFILRYSQSSGDNYEKDKI